MPQQPAAGRRPAASSNNQRQYARQEQPAATAQTQQPVPQQRRPVPAPQQPQRRPAPQPQQAQRPAPVQQQAQRPMHPQALQYHRQLQATIAETRALRAELAQVKQEMARRDALAQRQKVMHQYARELQNLERQGVELNIDEEIKTANEDRMTVPQMRRHLGRIAQHYGRSPVGGGLISTDFPVAVGRGRTFTKDDAENAKRLMRARGISYDEAVTLVKSGG